MEPNVFCNNCGREYEYEELGYAFDGSEHFRCCPVCETDAYLTDVIEIKKKDK